MRKACDKKDRNSGLFFFFLLFFFSPRLKVKWLAAAETSLYEGLFCCRREERLEAFLLKFRSRRVGPV